MKIFPEVIPVPKFTFPPVEVVFKFKVPFDDVCILLVAVLDLPTVTLVEPISTLPKAPDWLPIEIAVDVVVAPVPKFIAPVRDPPTPKLRIPLV